MTTMAPPKKASKAKSLRRFKVDEREKVLLRRIARELARQDTDGGNWTFAQFAEAGKTSRTTLYNYFNSLDGLMAALQQEMLSQVRPVVAIPEGLSSEERISVAVQTWLEWVEPNRALIVSTLWEPASDIARNALVASAKETLTREIIAIHLGVDDPSPDLVYSVRNYLGAAQDALRGWMVAGEADKEACQHALERLLRNVLELGLERDDVPKPLPGQS